MLAYPQGCGKEGIHQRFCEDVELPIADVFCTRSACAYSTETAYELFQTRFGGKEQALWVWHGNGKPWLHISI